MDTWRIVSQRVLLAALLTPLAMSDPRKGVILLKSGGRGRGWERPSQQGREVAVWLLWVGVWLSPRGLWTGRCSMTLQLWSPEWTRRSRWQGQTRFSMPYHTGTKWPGRGQGGAARQGPGSCAGHRQSPVFDEGWPLPLPPFSEVSELRGPAWYPRAIKEKGSGWSFLYATGVQRGPLKTCQAGSHLLRLLIPNPSWAGMGAGPQSTAEPIAQACAWGSSLSKPSVSVSCGCYNKLP